ncbi:hypothetical protein FOZ60_001043 [Perkinsus olseni]|uniref:Uncharacterized protein n=1 Tax=Perkinsus olseni TaxID=32597 RepID=A0A7J6P3H6_PEROL|nr:hypothetical protein FOZ60_001043 [Perkinsus olseni]
MSSSSSPSDAPPGVVSDSEGSVHLSTSDENDATQQQPAAAAGADTLEANDGDQQQQQSGVAAVTVEEGNNSSSTAEDYQHGHSAVEEEDEEMAMFDDLMDAELDDSGRHEQQEEEVAHVETPTDKATAAAAAETSPEGGHVNEGSSEDNTSEERVDYGHSEFDNQSLQAETKRLGSKVEELWQLVEHATTDKERTVTEMQKTRWDFDCLRRLRKLLWRELVKLRLDHNTQLSGLKSRLENAEAECRRLTKLHENAERKLEDTVKDLASARENGATEKSSLEGIVSLKQQMVSNLEEQLKTQSGELAETKQELNNTLCSLSVARGKAETVEKERAALMKERDELKDEKEKYLREKIAANTPTEGGRRRSVTDVAAEVLGVEAPQGGFPLSALVDALMAARNETTELRKANAHLEDLLDEVNGYVEAKAPEIDAVQRQNDDLIVKLQDANEKIEIGNARLRETKEKLNSESHTRRQMEASVSSLRLQLQEQVNQTSVLLHEVELLKGGAGMKRRRSSISSSSIEGAPPAEGSTPSFMTVAELVSQNTSLKASVARLRNECEIEAQKELAQLREDWQKMDEAYKELAKARETDRSTYEGLLSRADKEKKEMMQQIEELRKSLQDTASAATQADGTGDAGAGSGSSPSRGSSSAERKISLLQDKLETSVISEAMSELRASLKRVEDDARTTEKRSASLAAQNATLEGTVKTVVHERSIALREKSEALEKMHSAQARVEVFSEQLQAVLGEKAKIASLLVETQQRVSEETQSAREMAREQTEKVLREMEELKNNLVFYRSAYEEQSSTLSSSKESIKRLEEESSKFADERRSWSVEKQSLIDKIKLYKGRASIGSPSPPPPPPAAAAAAESSATPSASSGGGPQLERMLNVARAEVESQKSSNEVLQTAVKSLEERIKSSDEKVAKLTADLKAKDAELTAARASVQNAEKKIQEFESKGGLARSDAEALREKIHNLEEDLKQAKSEIDLANAKAVEAGNALKDAKQEYTREFIKRGKEAEALVAARQERERAVDEMKKDIEELDKKLKEKG